MLKPFIVLTIAGLTLMACASTSGSDDKALQELLNDPRVDEQVDRICFNRNIDGFSMNARRSVVLRKGVRDKYLVTVSGGCPSLRYAQSIGIDSNTSCIGPGDSLIVSESAFSLDDGGIGPDRCFINRIYNWNEDAKPMDDVTSAMIEG